MFWPMARAHACIHNQLAVPRVQLGLSGIIIMCSSGLFRYFGLRNRVTGYQNEEYNQLASCPPRNKRRDVPNRNSGSSFRGTFNSRSCAILPVDGGFDTTLPIFICLVSAIGWFGCQIDSLLGAVLENQGHIGKHAVNLLATFSGAVLAVIVNYQFL